jgi:hypothetical protein
MKAKVVVQASFEAELLPPVAEQRPRHGTRGSVEITSPIDSDEPPGTSFTVTVAFDPGVQGIEVCIRDHLGQPIAGTDHQAATTTSPWTYTYTGVRATQANHAWDILSARGRNAAGTIDFTDLIRIRIT